jgi:hypothetical protein
MKYFCKQVIIPNLFCFFAYQHHQSLLPGGFRVSLLSPFSAVKNKTFTKNERHVHQNRAVHRRQEQLWS